MLYSWTPPSPVPPILPWVAVLLLLIPKANRSLQALWVMLPLVVVGALVGGLVGSFSFLPSEVLNFFRSVVLALGFGVAAVWLAAPYLCSGHRFLAFLKILLVQAGFGGVAYIALQDWSEDMFLALASMLYLGLFVLVLASSLSLAGLKCRHQYSPLRLSLWLLVWIVILWTAIVMPFGLFVSLASGGEVPWSEFGGAMVVVAGVSYATLLPFLLLSFLSSYHRDRLCRLLGLGSPASAPPVVTPTPASTPAT